MVCVTTASAETRFYVAKMYKKVQKDTSDIYTRLIKIPKRKLPKHFNIAIQVNTLASESLGHTCMIYRLCGGE